MKSFDTDCRAKDIWTDSISSGQDALCFDCRKELGDASTKDFICCEGCGTVKPMDQFEEDDRSRWKSLHRHSVLCRACTKASHTRKDATMVKCNGELHNSTGKGTDLPEYHFLESLLNDWRAKKLIVGIKCVRCFIRSTDCDRKDEAAAKTQTCVSCNCEKSLIHMAPIVVKEWLTKRNHTLLWRCYECQYPACGGVKCTALENPVRPVHAIPHNALHKGIYYPDLPKDLNLERA